MSEHRQRLASNIHRSSGTQSVIRKATICASDVMGNQTTEIPTTDEQCHTIPKTVKIPKEPTPMMGSTSPVVMSSPTLKEDYRCVCIPNMKDIYLKLLNDNIIYLIESIYTNRDKVPYNSAETRAALSMQMILSSGQLIPCHLSTQIAKDLDDLRKNEGYAKQWVNPAIKRKHLLKEIEILKKHTEIDDSISLNLADQKDLTNLEHIGDFDIHSGVSTLNVSAECPIEDEDGRGPGVENDTEIISNLCEKGISKISAQQFYEQVINRVNRLYQKYHQFKAEQLNHVGKMVEMNQMIIHKTSTHGKALWHIYQIGDMYIKYNQRVHNRLLECYRGSDECLKFKMFEMGFNYYILDGHSFQWCLPPRVMSILNHELAVHTELFASPINAYFGNYYSLFHIDRSFGALGQFSQIDFNRDIIEGTYEVNPPFIEQLFIESSEMIVKSLEQSQSMGRDSLFVYLMPNWSDSQGYRRLKQCPYLIDEIILPEKSHYYYQSSKHKLILANFETHILVVGTEMSHRRWTKEIHDLLILAFKHHHSYHH